MSRKIPHRCSRCGARHALKVLWKLSRVQIRCRRCGYDSFYVDKTRQARNASENCYCGAYAYPHRRGSGECLYGSNPYGLWKRPEWADGGVELSNDMSLPF